MLFEIVVFEHSYLYDSTEFVSEEDLVSTFLEKYNEYLSPDYYDEDDIDFSRGRLWLSFSDTSGDDKPKTIMLIGKITSDIEDKIKKAVHNFYFAECENCNSLFPKRNLYVSSYCNVCRARDLE